jgi:hypothetical protein
VSLRQDDPVLPPPLAARFEVVRRLRPIDLVAPSDVRVRADDGGPHTLPAPAPYVAATTPARDGAALALHLGTTRLGAEVRDGSVGLTVASGGATTEHRSRRHHRTTDPSELGLTLTGSHLTAWTREHGHWVARARHDVRDLVDVHDEATLAALQVETPAWGGTAGGFGQLGLRDVRLVSYADGTPLRDGDAFWLTATSAGPGFFDSGHTSVWRLDATAPDRPTLTHTADLFFRRPDRPGVFGDHATHLVRDGDDWLVATSTWGDFEQPASRAERRTPSTLRVTLARSAADLLHGTHVLDTAELPLPTTGFASIAAWDPHLVRRDDAWWVGYVSASRFFRFHPVVATGATLDDLAVTGAAVDRVATEGTTLLDVDGELVVLASDGRDGRRGQRETFPVFGTDLRQRGALDAPYPTNIPWPTLARDGEDWLVLCFNGRRAGGPLLGYGTHGDLVLMRSGRHGGTNL